MKRISVAIKDDVYNYLKDSGNMSKYIGSVLDAHFYYKRKRVNKVFIFVSIVYLLALTGFIYLVFKTISKFIGA